MALIHRMKLAMAITQELGGTLSLPDVQAYLFLFCHEYVEHNHYYDFIPQPEGPVSLQLQADKAALIKKGCLENSENWTAKPGAERLAVSLGFFEKIGVQKLKNTWQGKPSEALHEYIRQSYPQYFSISTTAALHNDDECLLLTIGYEGVSPEAYLNKLISHNIKLLCDVRKNAFSQKYGFSKAELRAALAKVGIDYQHIPDLGIVSEKRQDLKTDKHYDILFDEYEKETLVKQQDKLDLLMRLLQENRRIAITCFEENVYHCHRSRVAKALAAKGGTEFKIQHV